MTSTSCYHIGRGHNGVDLSEPEANNNLRVIGRRKNMLYRAVSL